MIFEHNNYWDLKIIISVYDCHVQKNRYWDAQYCMLNGAASSTLSDGLIVIPRQDLT